MAEPTWCFCIVQQSQQWYPASLGITASARDKTNQERRKHASASTRSIRLEAQTHSIPFAALAGNEAYLQRHVRSTSQCSVSHAECLLNHPYRFEQDQVNAPILTRLRFRLPQFGVPRPVLAQVQHLVPKHLPPLYLRSTIALPSPHFKFASHACICMMRRQIAMRFCVMRQRQMTAVLEHACASNVISSGCILRWRVMNEINLSASINQVD